MRQKTSPAEEPTAHYGQTEEAPEKAAVQEEAGGMGEGRLPGIGDARRASAPCGRGSPWRAQAGTSQQEGREGHGDGEAQERSPGPRPLGAGRAVQATAGGEGTRTAA